jgi:hypothetical protein
MAKETSPKVQKLPLNYDRVVLADIRRGRRGKHHDLVGGIFHDLETLPVGSAIKIPKPCETKKTFSFGKPRNSLLPPHPLVSSLPACLSPTAARTPTGFPVFASRQCGHRLQWTQKVATKSIPRTLR